jgi:hypothetical protein
MITRQFTCVPRARIWPAGGFALFLVALTAPRAAAADDTGKPEAEAKPDATTYDFEDELVRGDTFGPDGEVLHARKRGERTSLIRVRTHFMPELFKTAEDL